MVADGRAGAGARRAFALENRRDQCYLHCSNALYLPPSFHYHATFYYLPAALHCYYHYYAA